MEWNGISREERNVAVVLKQNLKRRATNFRKEIIFTREFKADFTRIVFKSCVLNFKFNRGFIFFFN